MLNILETVRDTKFQFNTNRNLHRSYSRVSFHILNKDNNDRQTDQIAEVNNCKLMHKFKVVFTICRQFLTKMK